MRICLDFWLPKASRIETQRCLANFGFALIILHFAGNRSLLDCNAFCKVSGFVHIVSAEHSSVIGQELQRHNS